MREIKEKGERDSGKEGQGSGEEKREWENNGGEGEGRVNKYLWGGEVEQKSYTHLPLDSVFHQCIS